MRGECRISPPCRLPSPSTRHTDMVIFPANTQRPRRAASLGGGRGLGSRLGSQTHLLSVAGGSLEVAEERPGLSDHRQQGRQLLEGQREKEEDTRTVTWRETGRETFQC